MSKDFRIAVDFDGICVKHEYPEVGASVPQAAHWLRKWQEAGAKIMLWTMRSDNTKDGTTLSAAKNWFARQGIELHAVNHDESQLSWTYSPKLYAHVYVDDAAAGVPLVYPPSGKRPFLNWDVVGPLVMQQIEDWKAKRMAP